MTADDVTAPVRAVIDAWRSGDDDALARLLADDLVSYITNGSGGVDRVDGGAGFIARLPDLSDATLEVQITQSVAVSADQALTMVEVRAGRGSSALHNFAAFLTRIRDGRIVELWMVDAKPAESDAFWS